MSESVSGPFTDSKCTSRAASAAPPGALADEGLSVHRAFQAIIDD